MGWGHRRQADDERRVVDEGPASAARAVVVGAELQAQGLPAEAAQVNIARAPGGIVGALHQQPLDGVVRLDRDHVEEIGSERGAFQLFQRPRQATHVGRLGKLLPCRAVAPASVIPEAQACLVPRLDGDGLFDR